MIEDKFEFELSDGMLVQCWEDEEYTYLGIGIVTLCLSTDSFKELMLKLASRPD